MRLIDAERIVYSWIIDKDGEEHDGITLQSIIDKMPTVDAVEVVRCKDCKKWETKNCPFARGFVKWHGYKFCAWGERKEDEEQI